MTQREVEVGTPVVHGHLVDFTDVRREAAQVEAGAAVRTFIDRRATIEQAKGVLMRLYGIDADSAWSLLRAFSQDTQRKVRDIAGVLVDGATAGRTTAPIDGGPTAAPELLEYLYEHLPGRFGTDA